MRGGENGGVLRSGGLGIGEKPSHFLYGRDAELGVVADLVEGVRNRGGVLLVRGEPGIGKSTLLAAAAAQATAHGMQVLSAVGVQSEAHLPFGGLYQVLKPILDLAEGLPARQRDALLAVFGMSDEGSSELFLIGLATLELIGEKAASSPILLIVEDAQWLDDPSCAALAFVARRLEAEGIVMLIAIRDGYETPFDDAGLPELRLQGLDPTASEAVLDAHTPGLEPVLRERILAEAAGNPLALVELPVGLPLEELREVARLPSPLPLTARLEWAFAAQASELPPATRTLLLVAAVDDGDLLDEVLNATRVLEGAGLSVDAVMPAVDTKLVEIEGTALRFRHPLVRSSIYQAANVSERQAAQAALSTVLDGQPDRQVWHRAAATLGPDEGVAAELDEAADRAERRGAVAVAITALERAAELSERPACRGGRLVRGAELEFELGRRARAVRLLRAAEALDLASEDWLRLSWLRDAYDASIWSGPVKVGSFIESAERMTVDGRADLALKLLLTIALTCYWANPDDRTRELVVAGAKSLAVADDSPDVTAILALAAPVQTATVVLERIGLFSLEPSGDPAAMLLIGEAASAVGDFERSTACVFGAAAGLRAQGRLGLLTQALQIHAFNAFYLGTWQQGCTAADEAGRLARETGQLFWASAADLSRATLDAVRGSEESAESLVAKADAFLVQIGGGMLALVQQARGIVDLAGGRHADAYGQLRRVFDPTDIAYHPFIRCWLIGELAEAAVHSGQQAEARVLLAELEPLGAETGFPYLQAALVYARPLLADDDEAERLFQAGLTTDLASWPFLRARLLLAYGAWLRRHRRAAESRVPLRAARETFDALGAVPWGERARQELRASGVTSRRRVPETRDQLTPQELQIAGMAAEGLSNREIGQQLYISHRTVGYHLGRIFPKLGITSRTQLHAAVLSMPEATG
jgi:DNA-binding CsgD family transcriptional regulator